MSLKPGGHSFQGHGSFSIYFLWIIFFWIRDLWPQGKPSFSFSFPSARAREEEKEMAVRARKQEDKHMTVN